LKEVAKYVESSEFSRAYIQKKYYDVFGFDSGKERLSLILASIEKY
jgi:hypothetical protein